MKLEGKKILVFVIASFLYIIALTFIFEKRGIIDVLTSKKELKSLKREVEILRERKERLEVEIKVLKENPGAIEGIARSELGLVYPEEVVVIIDGILPEFQK
ncbi:MAG: FtsB family cell division protein [Candidatus Aminicenantia bacterium]